MVAVIGTTKFLFHDKKLNPQEYRVLDSLHKNDNDIHFVSLQLIFDNSQPSTMIYLSQKKKGYNDINHDSSVKPTLQFDANHVISICLLNALTQTISSHVQHCALNNRIIKIINLP